MYINTMIKDLIYLRIHGGITPAGAISITVNGTYDVTNYATATVNVAGSGDHPTFNAPTISLSGSTLSISDDNNGNFSRVYSILANNEVVAETQLTTYDLSTLPLSSGTYVIKVIAYGTGFNSSSPSNTVTYTLTQLAAPSMTREYTAVSITDNDGRATQFKLYDNGTYKTVINKT